MGNLFAFFLGLNFQKLMAADEEDLSLENILNLKVSIASKFAQKPNEAPNVIVLSVEAK